MQSRVLSVQPVVLVLHPPFHHNLVYQASTKSYLGRLYAKIALKAIIAITMSVTVLFVVSWGSSPQKMQPLVLIALLAICVLIRKSRLQYYAKKDSIH